MSFLAIKERGLSARDDLGKTYGALRGLVVERAGDVDTAAWRKQGSELADSVRRTMGQQLGRLGLVPEPRPRRQVPVVPVLLIGAALGAAAVTAYVLYDRNRRERMQERLGQVGIAARDRYTQLGGVSGAVQTVKSRVQRVSSNGAELQAKVVDAISGDGELPSGLRVEVEGRTVYLKGEVADPVAADAAAERAHSVDGVVAVVNHTTAASR
jgi:hypothetical protein